MTSSVTSVSELERLKELHNGAKVPLDLLRSPSSSAGSRVSAGSWRPRTSTPSS